MKLFTKKDRSSFPYWFAHWCAFNMTALNLGVWKFRYLFHDFEKPWLKLFLPYEKVQKIHRSISPHHGEFFLKHGWLYWEDLVIDWECSRFTKQQSPWPAVDVLPKEVQKLFNSGATYKQADIFRDKAFEAIKKLKLNE